MRQRDLRALEFDRVLAIVTGFAASEPGRAAIEQMAPVAEADAVRDRLRAAAELVALRGHAGALPIAEFTDQRDLILAAARGGAVLDGPALVQIRDFVIAARQLAAFMRSRVDSLPHLGALAAMLVAPKELADAMLAALADDGGLLDDASRELFRLRNRLREGRLELEARLFRAINAPGMEQFVSDYLVTVRNRRFVLPLRLNYTEKLEGIVQDRSVSGETLFVEPLWAIELNNRLMMLEREAEAEERRILAALTAIVRGYARELRMTFDAMVRLDALNAGAIFAERFGCIEPEISDAGLELVAARHPMLVAGGREVVPIDIRIGADSHGIVISGPNTGGKTVALKTVGLLAMMAQAGLLIPAERAHLPAFRSCFVDIGDEQSIERNLSSFAAHIANLREIVESFAEPALVILDEPGAGTDPGEGAALAIGLMNYFKQRRCLLGIATHATAVKLYAYSSGGFEAAAVDFDPERLTPLYRLKPHTIGESYGLAVARRLGLPDEIIRAAEAARGEATVQLDRVLRQLEEERKALGREREQLVERERELARLEERALAAREREREKFEAEGERLRSEAQSLISDLRRQGVDLAREIRQQTKPRSALSSMLTEAAQRAARLGPEAGAPGETAPQAPFRIGEQVEVGDLRGELIQLDQNRAVIGRGALRIEVAPERLRRAKAAPAPARTPQVTVTVAGGESGELNLIGARTADALRRLEEFLDQAYLTNRTEVRIVHGIGSGALRKAIHEYLADSPYAASFREAEPHQGGAGATIVTLRL
ncbi:MAG TPA: endonuclease MutS2 [Candidatus Binataceae bacterium]|nr:endonuclease MutS2 [Candidatus Binataceae bacterium]